jgi:hypothetical protein
MKNFESPMALFEKKYYEKCVEKSCKKGQSSMVYSTDNNQNLFCVLALNALLQIDRGRLKNKG